MRRAVLRFVFLYALVAIALILYLQGVHRLSLNAFARYGTLTGIGGVFVFLLLTRFGGGYVEDAMHMDEESEQRRKSRRSWMFAALSVAITLLLTGAIWAR